MKTDREDGAAAASCRRSLKSERQDAAAALPDGKLFDVSPLLKNAR